MAEIIAWPVVPRPAPVIPENEPEREQAVMRLSIALVNELDFTLRKLVSLRGAEHALFMVDALITLQKLRPEDRPAESVSEAPCA